MTSASSGADRAASHGPAVAPLAPGPETVMAQARDENFPVASRLLPRRYRSHLLAVYGFARLVDDAGDEARGDRLVLLDELERDLERVFDGAPRHPLLVRLQPTVAACALPIEPFRRLIEAGRRDQIKRRYQTYEELLGYCELSANPVGELVLRIFDLATPERLRLSDAVCSGLQLVEHCQDVAEDYRRGRIYLPAEDLERFEVAEEDLAAAVPTPGFRRLMACEVARARRLLEDGAPLLSTVRGRPRVAVAGFLAGGSSALRALERADYDVLGDSPRPSPAGRAAQLIATLARGEELDGRLEDAYRACEAVTRERAANFYYGIRLLPAPKRRAMCAVYAFARRVDDIGDGDEEGERKLLLLASMRAELDSDQGDHVRVALADAERRFGLPRDALEDLIAGVEMDVRGQSYESFDQLVVYCRRVAGSIGRLCLAIFGSADPVRADPLADDLGVALQLTNILRDVREDLDRGRVYLPAEDLRRFGIDDRLRAPPAAFARLIAFEVARAREWFDRGMALLGLIDGRSGSCVSAMAGIYRRILERIDRVPLAVLDDGVSLPPWEKTWVTVRSLARAAK